MALVCPARNGCAPMPTSGRKNLLSPSGWVEPAPPNDGDARKPRTGGASAVGGTRATNPCSIRILISASRLNSCPTGVLLPVGSTPSSAIGAAPKGVRTVAAAGGRSLSGGVLVSSGEGRPPLSGSRAPSIPGRSHFCGSGGARGPSTRDGPVQRPRKPGLMFAAGVPPPNRARTAASR
jgi:hypothetical protein